MSIRLFSCLKFLEIHFCSLLYLLILKVNCFLRCFIDLEYWGESKTFLVGKTPGILDEKGTFMWAAGGQRERESKR